MSSAVATFGRFNAPTEIGHGKLIKAVQNYAQKIGATHFIFPSHSQDPKKNPLSHAQKVEFMRRLFSGANIVSNSKIRTMIDVMKFLESKGFDKVVIVVGSDRVTEFNSLLNKYRTKEFPKIKSVKVISAGHRDPDAEGAEGMSASKLRELVRQKKEKEFISNYSNKKLGAEIYNALKKGMQMESTNPIGIFLLGGPGSGKDYVLNNIFSRFDLIEVQIDHVLNGAAKQLIESNQNIVINGALDEEKMSVAKQLLEGYSFDHVFVSVTNKVSRDRNADRSNPLDENKRLEKWYRAEKFAESLEEVFVFKNSLNLNESSEFEKIIFASQIEKLLERIMNNGLLMKEESKLQSFSLLREKKFPPVAKDKESGLPKKYVSGLSASTAKARKTHWEKTSKMSDKDPRAYEPAPGDKTAETKPSKHTLAVRKMMKNEAEESPLPKKLRHASRSGNITKVMDKRQETGRVNESDSSLAAKAEKSGVSVGTLRKVYKRGVAAWNSGHRPGTTPQQWGHARVNSYINKGKTYHTADKDLREDSDIDELFEMQLVGTDEYRKHAIAMTPGQEDFKSDSKSVEKNKKPSVKNIKEESELNNIEGSESGNGVTKNSRKFNEFRTSIKESTKENDGKEDGVDLTPTLSKRKKKSMTSSGRGYDSTLHGMPVTSRFNALEEKQSENVTLEEAIQYHLENEISFTENVFRPGSEMFFEMISEAKRLYKEGKYVPKDEWEADMLQTEIGEIAEFEGQAVVLDFPIEYGLEECWTGYTQKGMKKKGDKMVPNCVPVNEEDKTDGKGIGKPWREGGGGAVYVRAGDGGVKKVRFSQSGMKKKFMDPAATRSFVARHRCLTNKDKTSASYWACRYPRFFSNSGKTWW
jgi:hypothetical protein